MTLIDTNLFGCEFPADMNRPYPSDSLVAQRITQLRLARGFEEQVDFAKFLGVSKSRLGNVENGAPLGKDLAFKMVQKIPGLTTDWLWFGDPSGLSLQMAQLLDAAPSPSPGLAKGKTRA